MPLYTSDSIPFNNDTCLFSHSNKGPIPVVIAVSSGTAICFVHEFVCTYTIPNRLVYINFDRKKTDL